MNNQSLSSMLDQLDLQLIQQLQKDGRQSYIELAKKLGVVEGTVRNRLKRLIRKNLIDIVAVPNLSELGYKLVSIMALQVRMADLRPVAESLSKSPNVCYLAFVTGRYDLMAIIVTSSHKELSDFIEREISSVAGVLRTETFVNLDVIKGEASMLETGDLINVLKPLLGEKA